MAKKQKKALPKSNKLASSSKVRVLKTPKRSLFKRNKGPKPPVVKLPSAFKIFKSSIIILKQNWKLFLGITLVYAALTLILVRGFSGSVNVSELKNSLTSTLKGNNQLSVGVTLFGTLLGSSNAAATEIAGLYQTILVIIVSLSSIWALRQVHANPKTKLKIRDAFYKSTHPLIPFILVLLVVGLQLVPMLIGAAIYTAVINNDLAVSGIEQLLWGLMLFLTAVASLYMITSSVFALYVVTLSNMTPMKALRSARELVRYRRWMVLRKILFLPFALLLITAVLIIPLIIVLPVIAGWVYFVLSIIAIVIVHSYMYSLYRELL